MWWGDYGLLCRIGELEGEMSVSGKYFIDGKWRTLEEAAQYKADNKEIAGRLRDGFDYGAPHMSDDEILHMHKGTLLLAGMRLGITWRRFKAAVIKHVREGLVI